MNEQQYFISKDKYKGEVVYLNCKKIKGYKMNPKNRVPYDGIVVNEIIIIKPTMIEKLIKRKIKKKLEFYYNLVIDTENEDSSRRALGDLERYKKIISDKYIHFLDDKYIALLMKKISILEKEIKSNMVYSSLTDDNVKQESRSR